jgi:hypothetical protein
VGGRNCPPFLPFYPESNGGSLQLQIQIQISCTAACGSTAVLLAPRLKYTD